MNNVGDVWTSPNSNALSIEVDENGNHYVLYNHGEVNSRGLYNLDALTEDMYDDISLFRIEFDLALKSGTNQFSVFAVGSPDIQTLGRDWFTPCGNLTDYTNNGLGSGALFALIQESQNSTEWRIYSQAMVGSNQWIDNEDETKAMYVNLDAGEFYHFILTVSPHEVIADEGWDVNVTVEVNNMEGEIIPIYNPLTIGVSHENYTLPYKTEKSNKYWFKQFYMLSGRYNSIMKIDNIEVKKRIDMDYPYYQFLYNGYNSQTTVKGNLEDAANLLANATAKNALVLSNSEVNNVSEIPTANIAAKNGNKYLAKSIVLTDAEPFYCPSDVEAEKVTYTRTFGSTDWQALYVPFNMSFEEWNEYAAVAEIMGVHTYDRDENGTIDESIIEFKRLKEGAVLKPNTPYVIKPNAIGEVTFTCTGKTLTATPNEDGKVWCASTRQRYTLTGVYQETPIAGNYAMIDGSFMKITSSNTQHPNRFYLTIEDVDNGYGAAASMAPQRVRIMVDGEEVDGIDNIFGNEDDACYDLSGRKIAKPAHGVYIKNGKKLFVK